MNIYNEDFIQLLNSKLDIVKIASKHTKLEKKGNIWVGCCPHPDHNDSTPSFRIWDNGGVQTWCCFGCHANKENSFNTYFGRDAVSFVRWMKSTPNKICSYSRNIKEIALALNIEVDDRESILQSRNRDLAIGHNKRLQNSIGMQYLEERGINQESITKWNLGFETNRITVPLIDSNENYLGFIKRSITDDVVDKYFVEPDNEIFTKSTFVYGMNNLDYSSDYIYVTEGVFDAILATQYGLKNVISVLGTNFTEAQAMKIARTGLNPVLIYDGDSAGEKGTRLALKIMLGLNIFPDVVSLPYKVDLADYSLKYKESLNETILGIQLPYWHHILKDLKLEYDAHTSRLFKKYSEELNLAINSVSNDEKQSKLLEIFLKSEFNLNI